MTEDRDLRQSAARGVFWGASSQGLRQVIQLGVTAVLARFVLPEQFGLMGMASVTIAAAAPFNDMGMGAALVQRRHLQPRHVSAVFWSQFAAGMATAAAMALAAPWIAGFFRRDDLVPLVRVLSLNLPIAAMASAPQALLLRGLRFRSLALLETTVLGVAGGVAAVLAVTGWGVWSLVAQSLVSSVVTAIAALVLAGFNPLSRVARPAFGDLRDLAGFSGPLAGYQALNFVARNIDDILIGRFLGASALGYYSMAYRVMMYPLQKVSGVVERVSFPAFSSIQEDRDRIRSGYIKATQYIALVTFPMMAVVMVTAPEFTHVLFGPAWAPAAPLIMILSFAGLAGSIGTTVGNIFLVCGRSDLIFKWGIFASLCSLAAITIGLVWGLLGVAVCYTFTALVLWPLSHAVANRLINLPLGTFYRSLVPPAVLAAVIAVLITLLRFAWAPLDPSHQAGFLLVCGLIAAGVYAIAVLLGRPRVLGEALALARETLAGAGRERTG